VTLSPGLPSPPNLTAPQSSCAYHYPQCSYAAFRQFLTPFPFAPTPQAPDSTPILAPAYMAPLGDPSRPTSIFSSPGPAKRPAYLFRAIPPPLLCYPGHLHLAPTGSVQRTNPFDELPLPEEDLAPGYTFRSSRNLQPGRSRLFLSYQPFLSPLASSPLFRGTCVFCLFRSKDPFLKTGRTHSEVVFRSSASTTISTTVLPTSPPPRSTIISTSATPSSHTPARRQAFSALRHPNHPSQTPLRPRTSAKRLPMLNLAPSNRPHPSNTQPLKCLFHSDS